MSTSFARVGYNPAASIVRILVDKETFECSCGRTLNGYDQAVNHLLSHHCDCASILPLSNDDSTLDRCIDSLHHLTCNPLWIVKAIVKNPNPKDPKLFSCNFIVTKGKEKHRCPYTGKSLRAVNQHIQRKHKITVTDKDGKTKTYKTYGQIGEYLLNNKSEREDTIHDYNGLFDEHLKVSKERHSSVRGQMRIEKLISEEAQNNSKFLSLVLGFDITQLMEYRDECRAAGKGLKRRIINLMIDGIKQREASNKNKIAISNKDENTKNNQNNNNASTCNKKRNSTKPKHETEIGDVKTDMDENNIANASSTTDNTSYNDPSFGDPPPAKKLKLMKNKNNATKMAVDNNYSACLNNNSDFTRTQSDFDSHTNCSSNGGIRDDQISINHDNISTVHSQRTKNAINIKNTTHREKRSSNDSATETSTISSGNDDILQFKISDADGFHQRPKNCDLSKSYNVRLDADCDVFNYPPNGNINSENSALLSTLPRGGLLEIVIGSEENGYCYIVSPISGWCCIKDIKELKEDDDGGSGADTANNGDSKNVNDDENVVVGEDDDNIGNIGNVAQEVVKATLHQLKSLNKNTDNCQIPSININIYSNSSVVKFINYS